MAYGLGMTRLIDTSLKTALWSSHVEGKTYTVWPWRCRSQFLYMRSTEKYLRKKKKTIIIISIFFQVYFITESFLSWNTDSHFTEWVSSIRSWGNTIKCCIYKQGLWAQVVLPASPRPVSHLLARLPAKPHGSWLPVKGFFFPSLENMNSFTKNRCSCFFWYAYI